MGSILRTASFAIDGDLAVQGFQIYLGMFYNSTREQANVLNVVFLMKDDMIRYTPPSFSARATWRKPLIIKKNVGDKMKSWWTRGSTLNWSEILHQYSTWYFDSPYVALIVAVTFSGIPGLRRAFTLSKCFSQSINSRWSCHFKSTYCSTTQALTMRSVQKDQEKKPTHCRSNSQDVP